MPQKVIKLFWGILYFWCMKQFRKKQPVDYSTPYSSMLDDIVAEIKYFQKTNKMLPNYIIISDKDYELLVGEAIKAKMIPEKEPGLTIIQSARLMPSPFMAQGWYDVVGN